jgi:DNA-binding CsgD family transcriptional regulator
MNAFITVRERPVKEAGGEKLLEAIRKALHRSGTHDQAIAQRLNLSSKTVDVHREHLQEKLQIENAISLLRYAVRWVESQGSARKARRYGACTCSRGYEPAGNS